MTGKPPATQPPSNALLHLYCTDQTQHHRTPIGWALPDNQWQAATRWRWNADLNKHEPHTPPRIEIDNSRDKIHIRCFRCGRNVQWRTDTAARYVDKLREAGLTTLDISAVPV